METAMVGLQVARRQGKPGGALARLVSCAALLAFIALPAGAQSDPAPSIHTPAIRANKIVFPKFASTRLTANHASYLPGQPVLLEFKVANPTSKPIRYDFAAGTEQADFTVADSHGNTVWSSTGNKISFRGITHLILRPGEIHVYRATWNQRDLNARPVPSAAYTVTASLNPMPRVEVSGGLIVNTDRDPANLGMPMKGKSETGETIQQDTTPPVSASTKITIISHG